MKPGDRLAYAIKGIVVLTAVLTVLACAIITIGLWFEWLERHGLLGIFVVIILPGAFLVFPERLVGRLQGRAAAYRRRSNLSAEEGRQLVMKAT